MDVSLLTSLWVALPLLSSPVIYLIGRLTVRRTPHKANPAGWLAVAALAIDAILLALTVDANNKGIATAFKFGDVVMRADGISFVLGGSAVLLGLLVTIFSLQYMAGEEGEEKYYALLTAMIGTIVGLGCTRDLFNLWVWFEAMAITSYMLVAFYREQPASLEAGIKYLVQSAVGSTLVLLGIALVFASTGSLDLDRIMLVTQSGSTLLLAAGALFLIGFGVKAALVPMHTWLPDAHSMAPSGISAMLSGVVIEAGLVALLRVMGAISGSSLAWGWLLLGFGLLNMTLGNLLALRQTQVKRLLAFSSISHVGYMLVGLGLAVTYGLHDGAAGAFFHLITHALMKGLAFLAVGALMYGLYLANHKHDALMVDDLNGASKRYPLAVFGLSIAVLGLGGLPPLAGFMSKWQIFVAGAEAQSTAALVIVIYMALNSVLSLGYYAPLVNRMYRKEPSPVILTGKRIGWQISLPLVLLTSAVILLGVYPTALSWLTDTAATSLLALFGAI